LILAVATSQTWFGLWLGLTLNPVFDLNIFRFEENLGIRPTVVATGISQQFPAFGFLAGSCYMLIPLGMQVLVALVKPSSLSTRLLFAFIGAGVVAPLLYVACPVAGPRVAVGDPLASKLEALSQHEIGPRVVATDEPRNGMPSLHTAWALLLLLNASSLPKGWRRGMLIFAALNIWTTLGAALHWLLDLVVAVPFGVIIQVLLIDMRVGVLMRSLLVVATSAAFVAGWLPAVTSGAVARDVPSLVAWGALLLTVVIPIVGVFSLRRRALASAALVPLRTPVFS
jgi:hypothetical protein